MLSCFFLLSFFFFCYFFSFCFFFFFFFFFQAEDGIRDWSVTSSDVCSSDLPTAKVPLPSAKFLSRVSAALAPSISFPQRVELLSTPMNVDLPSGSKAMLPEASSMKASSRSEERRVGKECRSGWSRYHEKKHS